MARTKISEFSPTPASNTDIDGINIAENCPPSGINDAIRELMAQLKDFQTGAQGDSFNGPVGTTTAVAGAFTTLSASGTTTLSGLTASTALALDASKNVVSVTNTGTGNNVLATSPTLVTPALGTPSSATLTNATGLPISTGVSGLGTGIATALAVNVGTAGAPVINGGALGTPSSGTVTNLTGTASININGTVGATTPTTGAFTTLTTSSTVTLNGGTANGVAYLNGSKVLTSGSALTFNGSNALTFDGGSASYLIGPTGEMLIGEDGSGLYIGNGAGGLPAIPILFGSSATTFQRWFAGGSEAMRLTSTGLGIGTSSPGAKLDVVGLARINTGTYSAGYGLTFQANSETSRTYQMGMVTGGNFAIYDSAAAATRVTLDTSGNLGLGVTPSAWSGYGLPVLELPSGGTIVSAGTSQNLGANWYYSGGSFLYKTTAAATYFQQASGAFKWYTAPSGTAGNAISFTQAMSLGSDGNLLIGTTSGSWTGNDARIYSVVSSGWAESLYTTGSAGGASIIRVDNTGAQFINFRYTATGVGSITTDGTTTAYNTSSDYRLKNITGPITTSGAYIDSLNPVEGTWKADGSTFVGLIAHEVQEASRTTVATGVKDGEQMQGMDYSSAEIIANMLAELKSLRARVAALEAA